MIAGPYGGPNDSQSVTSNAYITKERLIDVKFRSSLLVHGYPQLQYHLMGLGRLRSYKKKS